MKEKKNIWFMCQEILSRNMLILFSKPSLTQKEKLDLKTYNSSLLDICRISAGKKTKKH